MGYLILFNGVPIGYGGASLLFKQVNTGINIFDDYRGSEAAYLWVQVMRVYHSLVGCTRFVASAYQLGQDHSEALLSGAFWFYYLPGYRPVRREIRELRAIAPLIVASNPQSWPDSAKRAARKILRAKGGQYELGFARRLCDDSQLLAYCRAACQREEGLRVSAPH